MHFSAKLDSVKILRLSELESVRIGKCQNWKVPELESFCRNTFFCKTGWCQSCISVRISQKGKVYVIMYVCVISFTESIQVQFALICLSHSLIHSTSPSSRLRLCRNDESFPPSVDDWETMALSSCINFESAKESIKKHV